ncbi:protein-export chaperone SecB [Novosphingobium flavum]|uniref:Protein-export protein SecB n=1 Tax=Novosphingobium flavum TaxID=1778672 RepID=A0A7X1FV60_9SPHN|nr:protein-export chaperone SecB [Novosphingobium flavum]MBC2666937.1 protein-export chaperone SecB [Novosphingobium flavum]
MADEGNVISDLKLDAPAANGEDTGPAAGVISQYVKDLSVENPNAPHSYQWTEQPQLDVQFNIQSTPVDGEVHEVELKIQMSAKSAQGTAYIIELSYGGIVGMRGLAPEQMHAFLYGEAPRILFPFARRILADAVRDAGYPPVLLEPIDFNGLYLQQIAQAAQTAEAEPAGNA